MHQLIYIDTLHAYVDYFINIENVEEQNKNDEELMIQNLVILKYSFCGVYGKVSCIMEYLSPISQIVGWVSALLLEHTGGFKLSS